MKREPLIESQLFVRKSIGREMLELIEGMFVVSFIVIMFLISIIGAILLATCWIWVPAIIIIAAIKMF